MYHLRQIWINVTSSLWFVPLAMVVGAITLAMILITSDLAVGNAWTARHTLLFGVGAAGARGMLSAIAGSMMTVASLTFSLTISTLAAAASQYSSRLIRNFMRDQLNQLVLGYFVGLFAYCLIVLRTIRGGDEGGFVPSIAVMAGLLLALVSIGVLIFFIHHIAGSIQAGAILERVTGETIEAIEALFPEGVGEAPDGVDSARDPAGRWYPIAAARFGYVQSLDTELLLTIAVERDTVIRMSADVGAFVTSAGALCEIALAKAPDRALTERLREAFDVGAHRTIEQDVAFGIRQIVDIALKALSPGINDTTTGVMCVDHLAATLELLAGREIPDRLRAEDGVVRFIASARSFDSLAGLCLDQIRQSASGNVAVMVALLRAVATAGRATTDPARRRTFARHATLVATLARRSVPCGDDRRPIRDLAATVLTELAAPLSAPEVE